jgi:hypothetical protein
MSAHRGIRSLCFDYHSTAEWIAKQRGQAPEEAKKIADTIRSFFGGTIKSSRKHSADNSRDR